MVDRGAAYRAWLRTRMSSPKTSLGAVGLGLGLRCRMRRAVSTRNSGLLTLSSLLLPPELTLVEFVVAFSLLGGIVITMWLIPTWRG
jgi:hypothetical protein